MIVVTAEKREQSIQDVPAAVTALSGEALEDLGITDLASLGENLPGVQIFNFAGIGLVTVRGISQAVVGINANATVGYNVNGVNVPREANSATFFDVERVEVLPGPQGTLYGGSAAGGIVNLTTRRPSDEYEGEASVETGNYGRIRAYGGFNLPLHEVFKLRAAVEYSERDGYFSNGAAGLDAWSGRLTGLYEPTDKLSITTTLTRYQNSGLSDPLVLRPGFSQGNPQLLDRYNGNAADVFETPANADQLWPDLYNDSDNTIATVEVNYLFENVTLTNITGYVDYNIDLRQPSGFNTVNRLQQGTAYSNELRIASYPGERGNWTAGIYWRDLEADQAALTTVPADVFPPNGRLGAASTDATHRSYAVFGQYTYSLTDRLRLTAGARYSRDEKFGGGNTALPGTPSTPDNTFGGSITRNNTDWKLGIEADLSGSTMLYVTAQTGYLPGGFATVPQSAAPSVPRIFEPEELLSFSFGTKSLLLGDRLQINNEIYYYDFENYQQNQTNQIAGTNINFTYNAEQAEIYGDQLDIRYLVTDNDILDFNMTAMSASFKEFVIPGIGDFSGFEMPYAPKFSATLGWQHTWNLNSGAGLVFGARARYNDGYWGTYNQLPGTFQDNYTNSDVTLGYESASGSWDVEAYVRNVSDETYYSTMIAFGPTVLGSVAPPQTYGIRLNATF